MEQGSCQFGSNWQPVASSDLLTGDVFQVKLKGIYEGGTRFRVGGIGLPEVEQGGTNVEQGGTKVEQGGTKVEQGGTKLGCIFRFCAPSELSGVEQGGTCMEMVGTDLF